MKKECYCGCVPLVSSRFLWLSPDLLSAEVTKSHASGKRISVDKSTIMEGESGVLYSRHDEGKWAGRREVDGLTSWSDPHVLLTIQHEAAHWLALWTVCCSLAH